MNIIWYSVILFGLLFSYCFLKDSRYKDDLVDKNNSKLANYQKHEDPEVRKLASEIQIKACLSGKNRKEYLEQTDCLLEKIEEYLKNKTLKF